MNKGCFKKGDIPWNKNTVGVMKPNRTSYKVGERAGSKNNTWKGGLQKNRDGYYVYIGVGKRVRRARHVWEKENGEIPAGYVIIHLDGDCFNDDINNLEAITRGELAIRNKP